MSYFDVGMLVGLEVGWNVGDLVGAFVGNRVLGFIVEGLAVGDLKKKEYLTV